MDARTFAVERLSVGDWPHTVGVAATTIDPESWVALTDEASAFDDPVTFAFDVAPDRSWSSVAAAGRRRDGLLHVEVADRRRGTGWVVPWLLERHERHNVAQVVCDGSGPAASLLRDLEAADVDVLPVSAKEHAQACGTLFDAVEQGTFRHLGSPELLSSVKGATTRAMGDAWAWSRKSSAVDITPLVAATLAVWGASQREFESVYETREVVMV
jgi:hypothetical protein